MILWMAWELLSVVYLWEDLKAKRRRRRSKQWTARGVKEAYPGDGYGPPDEAPFEDTPEESAPSASDLPAVPSPTTTTLPVAHPATSSPTTTPPMAEIPGFTGMPYPTYGLTLDATLPTMRFEV